MRFLTSQFNYAGPIPVEYYLTRTAPEPKDYMETFNIIAGPGGKKKISLKVENINSIFRLLRLPSINLISGK